MNTAVRSASTGMAASPRAMAADDTLGDALVDDIAGAGLKQANRPLPHASALQKAFGRHSLRDVKVADDTASSAAAEALDADAYAMGDRVALPAQAPLHDVAHEAAHAVLGGPAGHAGDAVEQHADAVADAVVGGQSAEALLDAAPANSGAGDGVRRVVSIGGNMYPHANPDKMKLLSEQQKQALVTAMGDRTQIFDFKTEDDVFDHYSGKKTINPTVTPIDPLKLQQAKQRKNTEAFFHNTESLGELTDNKAFHNLPHSDLPVWKTAENGPKGLVYRDNPEHKTHELFVRKKDKDPTALNQCSLTTYEEKGTGKLQYHSNFGMDMISSFTDTNVSSQPTGSDRDSAMGGFSSNNKDFQNTTNQLSYTIGHTSAYKDHIGSVDKKRKATFSSPDFKKNKVDSKTPDQDPFAFTPEDQYVGQHIRRTMVERRTRMSKGRYMEVNEFGTNPHQVKCGKKVPDRKHYKRHEGGTDQYAQFDQFDDWQNGNRNPFDWMGERAKLGKMQDVWEQQTQPLDQFPQEDVFDPKGVESWPNTVTEPQTPMRLDSFTEQDVYVSTKPLDRLQEVKHDGKTWKVWDFMGTNPATKTTPEEFLYRITREKIHN